MSGRGGMMHDAWYTDTLICTFHGNTHLAAIVLRIAEKNFSRQVCGGQS